MVYFAGTAVAVVASSFSLHCGHVSNDEGKPASQHLFPSHHFNFNPLSVLFLGGHATLYAVVQRSDMNVPRAGPWRPPIYNNIMHACVIS